MYAHVIMAEITTRRIESFEKLIKKHRLHEEKGSHRDDQELNPRGFTFLKQKEQK